MSFVMDCQWLGTDVACLKTSTRSTSSASPGTMRLKESFQKSMGFGAYSRQPLKALVVGVSGSIRLWGGLRRD